MATIPETHSETALDIKNILYRYIIYIKGRSSSSQMFFKISVLKNFAIFTVKNLCWSPFSIKLLAFMHAIILKRDSNTVVLL